MNAPDSYLVEQHPPLGMTDAEVLEAASGHPGVDAINAAMGPDHMVAEPNDELDVTVLGPPMAAKVFTPPENRPARVTEEITRLVHDGPRHMFLEPDEMADVPVEVDYLHSDLPGRGVLPRKESGYATCDLREELIHRGPRPVSRREAVAKRERQYIDEDLAAAVTGPVVKSVYLHCDSPFQHRPRGRLPDGTPFVPSLVAWPVPAGYTAFRIARMIAAEAYGCHWCGSRGRCPVILVSTGGALRLIATCEDCQDEFGEGPDYYLYDPWDEQHGFPCESER